MAERVNPQPILPRPTALASLTQVGEYMRSLVNRLFSELIAHAVRLNNAVLKDGTEGMEAPLPLASFTVAGVPSASLYTGALIYVSNEVGGAVPAFSDGTNWRRVTDRAIIA